MTFFGFIRLFILGRGGLEGVDWLSLLQAARCVPASGVLLLSFRLLTALSFSVGFR